MDTTACTGCTRHYDNNTAIHTALTDILNAFDLPETDRDLLHLRLCEFSSSCPAE